MMNRSEETVAVRIPLRVWGRLASKADARGVDVADLLVAAAETVLGKIPVILESLPRSQRRSRNRCTQEQISTLKALIIAGHLTEQEMAMVVGCHANTVTNWKRKLREAGEHV